MTLTSTSWIFSQKLARLETTRRGTPPRSPCGANGNVGSGVENGHDSVDKPDGKAELFRVAVGRHALVFLSPFDWGLGGPTHARIGLAAFALWPLLRR